MIEIQVHNRNEESRTSSINIIYLSQDSIYKRIDLKVKLISENVKIASMLLF